MNQKMKEKALKLAKAARSVARDIEKGKLKPGKGELWDYSKHYLVNGKVVKYSEAIKNDNYDVKEEIYPHCSLGHIYHRAKLGSKDMMNCEYAAQDVVSSLFGYDDDGINAIIHENDKDNRSKKRLVTAITNFASLLTKAVKSKSKAPKKK